jgi:hypothetical protein
MNYEIRTVALLVAPDTEPTFSEMATKVSIDDESGGGEFVVVEQNGRADAGTIAITPEEWPMLRQAIDTMISACRDEREEK